MQKNCFVYYGRIDLCNSANSIVYAYFINGSYKKVMLDVLYNYIKYAEANKQINSLLPGQLF